MKPGSLRRSTFLFFISVLGISLSGVISGCGASGSGSNGSGGPGGSGGGGTTPTPLVTSISPTSITAGSSAVTLTVNGSGFISTSVVEVNGAAEPTAYSSATQLTATVPASQITNGAELVVTVVNGSVSSSGPPVSLEVDNPAPTITSISPGGETVGAASAQVVVTGTGFTPSTVINVNNVARTTAFTSATQVGVTLQAADLAGVGTLSLTAVNPTPGGGTSAPVNLGVVPPSTGSPQISTISPSTIYTDSPDTTLTVNGANLSGNSVVEWNGAPLQTTVAAGYYVELIATIPAADLTSAGTASVTVETPGTPPLISNAVSVTIVNPPVPVLTSISPNASPIGTAAQVTLQGTGFAPSTTVAVNGTVVPSTYSSSTSITATLPASSTAFPGNLNLTVTTPQPGGGTSSAQTFTVYLPITANDIVFNPTDGLIYASVPVTSAGGSGNSVESIDPTTGNVVRQIWVGSNPNKLALSSDGTQLFVGLDGAASVAQVNLTQGKIVNQFSLGGGQGIYNPPMTALYLAAVPGSPNSVAVAKAAGVLGSGTGVAIYDSGVARANPWSTGEGPMSFGSSASTLYVLAGSTMEQLTVGPTGITGSKALATVNQAVNWMQYDNGRLYLSSGQIVNAADGTLLGTLYSGSNAAAGPIVSDSGLGRAFVAVSSIGNSSSSVLAFDESSFNLAGSIAVNGAGEGGYGVTFEKIVRWGQNGIALNASPGPFTSQSQLFIFQTPLVKDLSSSPADISVNLNAPATASTGTPFSLVATVKNLGPNASQGVNVSLTVDPSLLINRVHASTGSCGTGTTFSCDLGSLASGASASVTVNATPGQAGTLASVASVASVSYDPTQSNDQSTASTVVTGGAYGAMPAISAISPNLVQAGSSDFTLTVSGTGFNAESIVNVGSTALATTFVSATQLTATAPAAAIANYGWAPVTVSNPSPGGGVSPVVPLTIYDLVNVPASGLLFDLYGQSLYATVPSTATTLTGNSVVKINPVTGVVGTPVAVGSQPTVMAETTDGNYLYIGLSGANSVAQFNLLNQTETATIPLSLTQGGTPSSVSATYLAAMPGTDNTLAIGTTNTWGNFGIFDISGSSGTFRGNLSGIYNGVNPIFADASHLYAYDSQTSGAEFYRYSVNANGLTEIDGTTLDGLGGFQGKIQLANGLVYGAGGGIINPSTTPPSQVAALRLIDFYNSGSTPEGSGLAADPSLGKEFLMLDNLAGTSAFGLTRYDLTNYLPEAVLQLPSDFSSITSGWNILRWGQDGIAMLTSTTDPVTNQTTSSLILLRGPFVAPQELGTATAPVLTGSSTTTITHGSGNTMLTLTGTNFLPGVAVTWKGSYRTTTIVDATHVTVAIPASDVASAGSASLVATNPGSPASNALTITIN